MSQAKRWPPCIITVFDLVGTKNLAVTGMGSKKMIEMHNRAVDKINHGLPLHSHGYVWNDSILLLSYTTKPTAMRQKLLAELSEFKSYLEEQSGVSTYAISVKGLAFPHNEIPPSVFNCQIVEGARAVVLKTSSWAMANCFIIEKELGHYHADWYIDSRVTDGLDLPTPMAEKEIELLPTKVHRTIRMFKGRLHAVG